MKTYTAHSRTRPGEDPTVQAENLVFVKDGFTLWAAVFPAVWFLVHRMWLPLLAYLVISFGLSALGSAIGLSDAAIFPVALAFAALIGFEANSLRRWSLEKKGYRMVALASGPDREACEHRIYEKLIAARPGEQRGAIAQSGTATQPPPPPPGSGSVSSASARPPVVGMFPEPGR